ncbi:MAG: hypothetical protein AB1753_04420 [Thermoproteota archaeon]
MGRKALLSILFIASSLLLIPSAYAEPPPNCGRVFSGGPGVERPPEREYNLLYSWTFDIDGQKYDMAFDGYVTNAAANVERRSVVFDGRSEGSTLQVRLPRALIDSVQEGHDVPFTVLVNGQPLSNATEGTVPSTGDRIVCIPLPNFGPMARVEIIGTTVAPEFGPLALAVASMTMTGIIAFRRMSGTRPRT